MLFMKCGAIIHPWGHKKLAKYVTLFFEGLFASKNLFVNMHDVTWIARFRACEGTPFPLLPTCNSNIGIIQTYTRSHFKKNIGGPARWRWRPLQAREEFVFSRLSPPLRRVLTNEHARGRHLGFCLEVREIIHIVSILRLLFHQIRMSRWWLHSRSLRLYETSGVGLE